MDCQPGAVVVGVDGSPQARVAARLGAQEALHRGVPLELVLVLPWREPSRHRRRDDVDLAAMVHSAAGLILEATAAHAARFAPDVPISTRVTSGRPAEVLVAASSSAGLICLGSRGEGTLGDLLLGSVASAVVHHATCPVLVVPLRHLAWVHGRRSVVVGLDGEPGSEQVAAVALDAAAARETDVLAVHTWQHPYPGPAHLLLDPMVDRAGAQRREEDVLDDALDHALDDRALHDQALHDQALHDQALERRPAVDVRQVVEQGRPADALVAASLTAELLVVGHRRRAAGHLNWLGSVTSAVLHRAACPVLVVPIARTATAAPAPVTSATARP